MQHPQGSTFYPPTHLNSRPLPRSFASIAEVLADALSSWFDAIDCALIFGSVASGKATQASDIDVLIVGEIGFNDAVKALYPAQEILGREINPKLYKAAEWQRVKSEGSAFIRDVVEKPVIKIIGDKDDLG